MKARRSIYGSAISSVVLLCAIYLATPATAQGMWGFLKRHIAHLLGTACLMLCLSATALGQTSTITYQGRLTDAGSPPTGTYDIQFKLYDALTAGATTLTRDTYYHNLTINAGQTLNPGGFRVFVSGTLTLGNGTRIARDGNNARAGGAALAPGTLGGSGAGAGGRGPRGAGTDAPGRTGG